MPAPRKARVTQAQRRFDAAALAKLGRADSRKLVHALVEEGGAAVTGYTRSALWDELVADVALLWGHGNVRVRVMAREATQSDLDRFARTVQDAGDSAAWFIAPLGLQGALRREEDRVVVIEPDEFILRLERSSRIAWPERRPTVALDRLQSQRAVFDAARVLDPVGMRWLPVVAHNELPTDLPGGDAPQDWLERLTFRLLTTCFRFGGRRYGEATRGKRLPDAFLTWPATGDGVAALLDCKASADGYLMESDHLLRMKGYAAECKSDADEAGLELRYMLVVSSAFSGAGRRHPFYGRAKELLADTGLQLVYMRAIDLASLAVEVERDQFTPSARERLDWSGLFDNGLLANEHFAVMTTSAEA